MKAKIAIVDDNLVTVRSLMQTIDWEALGCEIAGTATDGQSGKALVLGARPDILLLDIQMPQMDGLQMLEEVREAVPDCKVIIITGYDKFQYASRAIKLSVFDYILKPIRNQAVREVVSRAVEEVASKRRRDVAVAQASRLSARMQLLSLLRNDSHAGQDVHRMLEEAKVFSPAYGILIASAEEGSFPPEALRDVDAQLELEGLHAVTLCLDDLLVVYVMLAAADEEAWRGTALRCVAVMRGLFPGRLSVGASELGVSHHAMRRNYQQARRALWSCVLGGEEACCFYAGQDEASDGRSEQMSRRIERLAESAELSEAAMREAAAELYELSGRQTANLRALVSLYMMLVAKRFPGISPRSVDSGIGAALFVGGETDAAQVLCRFAEALRGALEGRDENRYSLMTRSALEYIALHAAEPLRLSAVAEHFHVNANHLSQLIRRETGTTFHEHLLAAKLDVACAMLADPRARISDVAEAVGYSNYISFFNTFKRAMRMTPTEYRNRIAGVDAQEAE